MSAVPSGQDLGIARPPIPDPAVVAMVAAAVAEVWPRPAPPTEPVEESSWRWSGRWWARPLPLRRARPLAR